MITSLQNSTSSKSLGASMFFSPNLGSLIAKFFFIKNRSRDIAVSFKGDYIANGELDNIESYIKWKVMKILVQRYKLFIDRMRSDRAIAL